MSYDKLCGEKLNQHITDVTVTSEQGTLEIQQQSAVNNLCFMCI